jgi:hypothetical protein
MEKTQTNKQGVKSLGSNSSSFSASSGEVVADKAELEELRRKVWSYKRLPTRLAGYVLTFVGSAILVGSMVVSSSVWAMVGLPLVFWGILFFFLKPTSLVKAELLDIASISLLKNVNRLVSEADLKGRGVYLPPKYLKDLKEGLVFISAKDELYVPDLEEVGESGNVVFLKKQKGVFLVPSGVALVNLCEKELGTSFAKENLDYLMINLPKVFIEALEIAKDFEFNIEGDKVEARLQESIFKDLCHTSKIDLVICRSFGCPLCSSIACALTRASGKPVIIEEKNISQDQKIIDIYYRILEQ